MVARAVSKTAALEHSGWVRFPRGQPILKDMDELDRMKKWLIQEMYDSHIKMGQEIVNLAKEYDLLNTQGFINWQDELNNLSQLITK